MRIRRSLLPLLCIAALPWFSACGETSSPVDGKRDAAPPSIDTDASYPAPSSASFDASSTTAGTSSSTVADAQESSSWVAAADAAAEAAAAAASQPWSPDPDRRIQEETGPAGADVHPHDGPLFLSVQVRDVHNGWPLQGYRVDGGLTDKNGRYETWRELPDPRETITVRCPSRMPHIRTKRIGTAPFSIRDSRADAVIDVDSTQCIEPPKRTQRLRMTGIYRRAFEASIFIPCSGMPVEASYYAVPGGYWTEAPDHIHEIIDSRVPPSGGIPDKIPDFSERTMFVDWLGIAVGPGRYGHMGGSLYHLEVETLYRIAPTIPPDCRPKGYEHLWPSAP